MSSCIAKCLEQGSQYTINGIWATTQFGGIGWP